MGLFDNLKSGLSSAGSALNIKDGCRCCGRGGEHPGGERILHAMRCSAIAGSDVLWEMRRFADRDHQSGYDIKGAARLRLPGLFVE